MYPLDRIKMSRILDFLRGLVSPQQNPNKRQKQQLLQAAGPHPSSGAAAALADALARDVRAIETGSADPALKKAVMQKAKQIAALVGGNEMIIPGYAVAVSFNTISGFLVGWGEISSFSGCKGFWLYPNLGGGGTEGER